MAKEKIQVAKDLEQKVYAQMMKQNNHSFLESEIKNKKLKVSLLEKNMNQQN